jgi:hypothetical protein
MLRGATVIVVPDKDVAGWDYALHVARSLDGVAGSVVMKETRSTTKDVYDHLAAGYLLDDLVSITPEDLEGRVVESRGASGEDCEASADATHAQAPAEALGGVAAGYPRAPAATGTPLDVVAMPLASELAWPRATEKVWHGPAGAYALGVATYTEADPIGILVSVMAGLGVLIGCGPHVLAGNEGHPAAIWPILVGKTAKAGKGTAWAAARTVLERVSPSFFGSGPGCRVLSGFG